MRKPLRARTAPHAEKQPAGGTAAGTAARIWGAVLRATWRQVAPGAMPGATDDGVHVAGRPGDRRVSAG